MLGEGALVALVLGTSGALLYLQYLRNRVKYLQKILLLQEVPLEPFSIYSTSGTG